MNVSIYFTWTCDVHSPPLVHVSMDYCTKYIKLHSFYKFCYFHSFVLQYHTLDAIVGLNPMQKTPQTTNL